MLKVGLTGGLASGKSFVGACLRELGCHVIEADRLGHETLLPAGEAYHDVVREFGRSILTPGGAIDRKALGAIVFSDAAKLEKLNALVHPHVFRRQLAFFDEVEREDPAGIAVVEAAIMIEAGSYKRYHRIVLAFCPERLQIERFLARENADLEEARRRLSRQMPLAEKHAYADYLIDTSGSKTETRLRTEQVCGKLKAEAAEGKR